MGKIITRIFDSINHIDEIKQKRHRLTIAANKALLFGVTGAAGTAGNDGKSITNQDGWATATAYVNSAIEQDWVTHNGETFSCKLSHTSGASSEPKIGGSWATYWTHMVDKGDTGATGAVGNTGTTGAAGQGLKVEIVYQRAATIPSTPSGNAIPSGWFNTPPALDGNPLWSSRAYQRDDSPTYTTVTGANVVAPSAWSTAIQVDRPSTPLFDEYQLEWGLRGSNGQNIEISYELTNGGDRIHYEVTDHPFKGDWTVATAYVEDDIVYANAILYTCHDDHTSSAAGSGSSKNEPDTGDDWDDFWTRGVGDITAPSGDGTTISGVSNKNSTLAGAGSTVYIGEYRTVWLRASDGTENGTWFRRVIENKGDASSISVTFTDPTTPSGDSVNIRVITSFKNLVGQYKIEYNVTTDIASPPASSTITSSGTSGSVITIANKDTSTYNSTTGIFTERYLHYRILGGENMPLTEWLFVLMPTGIGIAVTKTSSRAGSTPNIIDTIVVTLDEIPTGWSVSCINTDPEELGGTILNGNRDVSTGVFQSGTEDWDFTFVAKPHSDDGDDIRFTIKVWTDQYRIVYEAYETVSDL